MKIIEHRINTIGQLLEVNPMHGVEIDLRSDPNKNIIYLHHDPFVSGESFERWLDVYVERKIAGPLILNTKEDGLEAAIIELMKSRAIEDFFFLDTALPTLVKWTRAENRFACRLSAYEPVESVLPFFGKTKWLWVDCFEGQALSAETLEKVRKSFHVCLVSPELHGVKKMDPGFSRLRNLADAVCTNLPHLWMLDS